MYLLSQILYTEISYIVRREQELISPIILKITYRECYPLHNYYKILRRESEAKCRLHRKLLDKRIGCIENLANAQKGGQTQRLYIEW